MNAKEAARITGLSVRTLHHYDDIGLLSPERNDENGYRVYTDEHLDRLQQILLFRQCGFPLAEIRTLLDNPSFDRNEAFLLQEKALVYEIDRMKKMLETLRKTIQACKGEGTMSHREKFAGFDMTKNPYEEEARQRWGDEAVDRSKKHVEALSPKERGALSEGMDELFEALAEVRQEAPESPAAQEAIGRMYRYFQNQLGNRYSPEAFRGLGQLYVQDDRFTANIDQYGEGLSAFLAKAMGVYADHMKK